MTWTLKLAHIPTVGGPSFPILSYIGAVRYLFHAPDILEEGYAKVSYSQMGVPDCTGQDLVPSA